MARCGCAAGCSCLVVGSSPVTVTGNGSPGAPFTVGISYNGTTGCAGIAACVADNLGAGLTYDQATGLLQAQVSRDPGNALTFGTDNGLFATGGGGGGGATCQKSVGSLPAAPGVAGGYSMAGLMGPYNSPYSLDYCIANNVDIVHFICAATADGAGWVAEYTNGQVSTTRSSIYESISARYLDSATVKSVWNYAGDVNDPYAGTNVSGRVSQSGWYGWLAPSYYQMLVTDALARLDGKAVALIDCRDAGDPDNIEATNVQAAIRAVRTYCAQPWSMVGVANISAASTAINAGIEAVLIAPSPSTWGATTLPYPVASVTGAGINWIMLSHYCADSVFTAYKNAGINVLMFGASRHVHKTRITTLGIRGFVGHDPVYTRGPGTYDYRRAVDPWSHRRPGQGQLTHYTDQTLVSGSSVRGYHRHPVSPSITGDEGLMLPARWGNGGGCPSVLCGWECNLQVATSYTISLEMIFDTLPTGSTGKLGVLFGMANDNPTFAWNGSDGNTQAMPTPVHNFYRAYQRVTGEIGIGIFDAAGNYADLQVLSSPTPATDVWNTYLLTVTPTQLTWRRTTSNGTNYTVTVANSVWRGPYFAVEKEELHPENSQYGFIGGFRNLTVTGQGDA
jgi:hypothetical protein